MIYALTVSGMAYLLKVRSPNAYAFGSVLPSTELITLDVQNSSYITAVEATLGCLMIGRNDGSVSCYQLGKLDQREPGTNPSRVLNFLCHEECCGLIFFVLYLDIHNVNQFLLVCDSQPYILSLGFMLEIRDDAGIGRLWSIMSRCIIDLIF